MIRITTKPANTHPTAVGTIVSTGSACFPPLFAKQTSATKQRQENEVRQGEQTAWFVNNKKHRTKHRFPPKLKLPF